MCAHARSRHAPGVPRKYHADSGGFSGLIGAVVQLNMVDYDGCGKCIKNNE